MHPDIEKFWTDKGYYSFNINTYYKQITAHNKEGWVVTLATWRVEPINYYFNGSFYSERTMLKLIKLKAFL